MLARWLFYVRLGLLDLIRLRSATQHHAIIVAGICLPLLLLLGLKRGHVAELRQSLLTSPSGRQVIVGSSRQGELLTLAAVERLEQELPAVEIIIPDEFRQVYVRVKGSGGRSGTSTSATLFSTRQRDPALEHLGAVLPQLGERVIVLRRGLADKLGVAVGDTVQVVVTRVTTEGEETAAVDLVVSSIIETGEPGSQVGYVAVELLHLFSIWTQGHHVEELGWPAGGSFAPAKFHGYVAFCPKTKSFSARDLKELDFNYKVAEVTAEPLADAATDDKDEAKERQREALKKLRSVLDRLLVPNKRKDLRIYLLSPNHPSQLLEAPFREEIYNPESTEADEIVIPWNDPLQAEVNGRPWTLVGLTLRRGRWLLKGGYFRNEALLSDVSEDPFQIRILESSAPVEKDHIDWPLTNGTHLGLKVVAGATASTPAETLAIVPADVVGWLTGHRANELDFDPSKRLFKLAAKPSLYNRARLYARTIDDVPVVVEALRQRHFSIAAEQARIEEIHRQDTSLHLLVIVVGAGVFLFGVVTVISVLHDSTDRKRGTIGILRVMGTSRPGIFLLILIRATVIGLLASGLCLLLGYLLAAGLAWSPAADSSGWSWKPIVTIQLHASDCLVVLGGSLLCCTLGALWPAWRASRLDPFDAIIEGRFH